MLTVFVVVLTILVVWMVSIGPDSVVRVITHGDTTVWDHLDYPGRSLGPSEDPAPWPVAASSSIPSDVDLGGVTEPLEEVLSSSATLGFLMTREGEVVYEWYTPGHSAETPVMVFSVSKSILSMLVGIAIQDGLIGSDTDPITEYVPEMSEGGLDAVSIRSLLTMDSSLAYVEGDNPFGEHVEFNYTSDLSTATLGLRVRPEPDPVFRYKSGDYAVLGLMLDRVLGEQTISAYLQDRLREPLGSEDEAVWSTDHEDGLERTWCCLATSARDLARLGQLMVDDGVWEGTRLIPSEWVEASLTPVFEPARWPAEYGEGPLANYGLGWWQTIGGPWLALGKDGQYLYLDPEHDVVVVRQGESTGDFSWVSVIEQVAAG
jgi:CubicO group peptidase (beta-lactamase class C family)